EGFDTTFQFQLGIGAEGLAFVIEGSSLPALSVGGAGLGYEGVRNSLAVEFDARANGATDQSAGPHISVQTLGGSPNSAGTTATRAFTAAPSLSDGNLHMARIRYQ